MRRVTSMESDKPNDLRLMSKIARAQASVAQHQVSVSEGWNQCYE
jgi:hypothetical protein